MQNQQAIQHMRTQLWTALKEGRLDGRTDLKITVLNALLSTNSAWIPSVFNYVRVQGLHSRNATVPKLQPSGEQLRFREPTIHQLKSLHGDLSIGETIPSGYPVDLPESIFGGDGYAAIYGNIGSGKSSNIDSLFVQLVNKGKFVCSFDTENQSAQRLAPLLPPDRLNIFNIREYKFNPLWGNDSIPQLAYIKNGWKYLGGSLGLLPLQMRELLRVCERIISKGAIANFERVIDELDGKRLSQTQAAILNRLLPLDDVFCCEKGFDREKVLALPSIFEVKDSSEPVRQMLYNDGPNYISQTRQSLNQWRLDYVFTYHEANELLADPSPYFLDRLKKMRNYGVGFLFADQIPQLQNDTVRALMGTKMIMRLGDPSCLNHIRVSLGLDQDRCRYLLSEMKPKREMLVYVPGISFPFLVRVPELY